MKIALISLLVPILLSLAAIASGRLFDAADFIAVTFATGLVAWTIAQYRREPRALTLARCIHLPVNTTASPATRSSIMQRVA